MAISSRCNPIRNALKALLFKPDLRRRYAVDGSGCHQDRGVESLRESPSFLALFLEWLQYAANQSTARSQSSPGTVSECQRRRQGVFYGPQLGTKGGVGLISWTPDPLRRRYPLDCIRIGNQTLRVSRQCGGPSCLDLLLLEPLAREFQCPAVLRHRANDVVRCA